jgi:hypothetical protein
MAAKSYNALYFGSYFFFARLPTKVLHFASQLNLTSAHMDQFHCFVFIYIRLLPLGFCFKFPFCFLLKNLAALTFPLLLWFLNAKILLDHFTTYQENYFFLTDHLFFIFWVIDLMNKTLNNLIVIFKINVASKFNINFTPLAILKGTSSSE